VKSRSTRTIEGEDENETTVWFGWPVLQALACAFGAGSSHTRQGERRSGGAIRHCRRTAPHALKKLCHQARCSCCTDNDVVSHCDSKPGDRRLEKHAALERLLQGTGLEAVYSNDNTATIVSFPLEKKRPRHQSRNDKPSQTNSPPTSSRQQIRVWDT